MSHAALRRAGFQLSARFSRGEAVGEQAGRLAGSSPRVAVTPGTETPIRYAHQTLRGSEAADTVAEWTVVWTAPERARAPVAFHLAANAANDDASEFGDVILTMELTSAPDPER